MRHSFGPLSLLLFPLLLAACGGSESTTEIITPGIAVSAGADSDAFPQQLTWLQGVGQKDLELTWVQLSGATVEIDDNGYGLAKFIAPSVNAELLFELQGSRDGVVINSDQKIVTVRTVRRDERFELLTRTAVGGPDARLTAMAFEFESRRVFILDESGPVIRVLDLTEPSSPQVVGELPAPSVQPGFTPGAPRVLASARYHGTVAVAYDNEPAELPGRLVLFDAATLTEIVSLEIGPRPVDLEGGNTGYLAVCAADPIPSSTNPGEIVDGRGRISSLSIPFVGPGSINQADHVLTMDFSSLDGERAALLADGVRLPRPGVDVSQDLEPRAGALMPDDDLAWISFPANNAMAVIDLALGEVKMIRGLEQADFGGQGLPATATTDARYGWTVDRPETAFHIPQVGLISAPALDIAALTSIPGDDSAIEFDFVLGQGLTRRSNEGAEATFFAPAMGHRLIRARVDRASGAWTIVSELPLVTGSGDPITGLPNLRASQLGLAHHDELPLDAAGQALPLDPMGAFFTGVTRVNDEIWCSDARRPSIYRFSSAGVLIDRFVPAGSNAFGTVVGTETLPAVYAQAVGLAFSFEHQGFRGIAATDEGEIATVLGMPLDNPDLPTDLTSQTSRILRLLLLDAATGNPVHEYALTTLFDGEAVQDLTWFDGALHVATDNDYCRGIRSLYRLDLSGATDLLALGAERPAVNAGLETTLPGDLATAFAIPILPVQRTLVSNLAAAGIGDGLGFAMAATSDGLVFATSDGHRLFERLPAVAGGISGGRCTSTVDFVALTSVGEFSLVPRSFDPSSSDKGLGLRNEPVHGIRQITGLLAARSSDGNDLVYALDEGLARQVPGTPAFEEAVAARDLVLDTTVFPDAVQLQGDSCIGGLRVSRFDGDSDGDGFYESIHAFGGRSLMTLNQDLSVISDTGDSIDRELRIRRPDGIDRYEASAPFSGAGGMKAATLSQFANQFGVAFPSAGVVAAFDGSNRGYPRLVSILPSALGAEPVDLVGYQASSSSGEFPNIVLVLDRGNGTLDVFERNPL